MHSKKDVEKIVREVVMNVTGINKLENYDSLVGKDLNINPADFLYIFDILEKQFQLPVHDIFISHTFEVMTIGNMTDVLFELIKRGDTEKTVS